MLFRRLQPLPATFSRIGIYRLWPVVLKAVACIDAHLRIADYQVRQCVNRLRLRS